MNTTIFVSYEAGQAVIDSLTAGTMVELKREPSNPKDPCAIQAILNEKPIGYVANSNKTLVPGTIPAAKISNNMDKPNVAGAYAKLIKPHTYGEKNERVRWEAELFWLPVWAEGSKEKKKPLVLKVGGTTVLHNSIAKVMNAIDSYKGGKLILKMCDNARTGLVPMVWIVGEEDDRTNSPAGEVQNPPAELLTALTSNGTLQIEPTKVLDRGNYEATVSLETSDMADYYEDMEGVIKRGVMQARDVKGRVKYLMAQAVPPAIIHGVLKDLKPNETGKKVIRPDQLFMQTAENNYLTRTIAYHLAGKNIRLVGEKGAGKNTLVYSVCWVLNQALCRIQGNSDMDKIDLLGGQALDDHGTHFQLSEFIATLMKGGDVVLDEINSVKPEIAILLHSLADDARSIEVPGYGFVGVHPNSRIWATMNEAYIGTGEMNAATADRFVPVYLADQMSLGALLSEMVPTAKKEDVNVCVTLYDKIKKAVRDGKCSTDTITTRGYIDSLQSISWLPLRTALMDNVANRPQDPDDRKVIAEFIRAVFPA